MPFLIMDIALFVVLRRVRICQKRFVIDKVALSIVVKSASVNWKRGASETSHAVTASSQAFVSHNTWFACASYRDGGKWSQLQYTRSTEGTASNGNCCSEINLATFLTRQSRAKRRKGTRVRSCLLPYLWRQPCKTYRRGVAGNQAHIAELKPVQRCCRQVKLDFLGPTKSQERKLKQQRNFAGSEKYFCVNENQFIAISSYALIL